MTRRKPSNINLNFLKIKNETMLTMQPKNVSEEKKIREMEANELAEFAARLAVKIDEETITPEELTQYNIARANYKQITGHILTAATMNRR